MIRVLQWNIRKEPHCLAQALYSDFDILAIQEPVALDKTLSCPRDCNFWLSYGGGRAAIYVHKRHSLLSWIATPGKDVCRVRLKDLTVFSVYSSCP